MSTYSDNLRLTLIGNGEQSGQWGTTTNTNLGTLLEQAISGYVQYPCTGGTDTITIPDGVTGVARNMYIELTGSGGGTLVVPDYKKLYFIYNNTSSGAVTVKVSGETGVSVDNGYKIALVCDGTDVVPAINYVPLTVIAVNDLDVTGRISFGNFTLSQTGSNLLFKATNLSYTASIATTTMTVTSATVGYVINGQVIAGTGVTTSTTVVGQLTSTETAAATIAYSSGGAIGDTSFTVADSTGIAIGQMISGTGVPTGTYVINVEGNIVYLGDYDRAPVALTIQAASNYDFKAARGKGTYTVSASQTVSSTTITTTTTVAKLSNTGALTVLGNVSSDNSLT